MRFTNNLESIKVPVKKKEQTSTAQQKSASVSKKFQANLESGKRPQPPQTDFVQVEKRTGKSARQKQHSRKPLGFFKNLGDNMASGTKSVGHKVKSGITGSWDKNKGQLAEVWVEGTGFVVKVSTEVVTKIGQVGLDMLTGIKNHVLPVLGRIPLIGPVIEKLGRCALQMATNIFESVIDLTKSYLSHVSAMAVYGQIKGKN